MTSIANADDNIQYTSTIKAGSHTVAQNIAHQKYCSAFGARDVTDKTDIKATSSVTDTVFCLKDMDDGQLAPLSSVTVGNFDNNPSYAVKLSVIAPSGNVGKGDYWIKGLADYSDAITGSPLTIDLGVLEDNCYTTGVDHVPGTFGRVIISVTCSYTSGKNPTQSHVRAYLQGLERYATGVIYHN